MAKDNIALLSEISASLRKLNQSSVRDKLRERELAEQQATLMAGGPVAAAANPDSLLTDAQDFKRRIKASMFTAKIAEKFTESGERAIRSNKEAKRRKPIDKKDLILDRQELKERAWIIKNRPLAHLKDIKLQSTNIIRLTSKTVAPLLKSQADFLGLIKVNSDKLVHDGIAIKKAVQDLAGHGLKKGSLFTHDIHTEKKMDQAQKATDKRDKLAKKNRMDDKRSLRERLLESKKKTVSPLPKSSGMMSKIGGAAKSAGKLRGALILAAVTWAVGGIGFIVKDFFKGYEEDGFAGGLGKALGGEGEGLWNSIKQGIKWGGAGVAIGAAVGALFGGVGAIPGAIIGGLLGMAIGAVAGYFGGDKITEVGKKTGNIVSTGWAHLKAAMFRWAHAAKRWFYTPGSEAQSPNHPEVKATMFGGRVSWSPTSDTKIADAFVSLDKYLTGRKEALNRFIYTKGDGEGGDSKIFGGLVHWDPDTKGSKIVDAFKNMHDDINTWEKALGNWFYHEKDGKKMMFGENATIFEGSILDKATDIDWKTKFAKLGENIASIPRKIWNSVVDMLPEWMQKGLRKDEEAEKLAKIAADAKKLQEERTKSIMDSSNTMFQAKDGVATGYWNMDNITRPLTLEDAKIIDGYKPNIITANSGNSTVSTVNLYIDGDMGNDISNTLSMPLPGGREIPWYLRGGSS
jgi:hypothetical protein